MIDAAEDLERRVGELNEALDAPVAILRIEEEMQGFGVHVATAGMTMPEAEFAILVFLRTLKGELDEAAGSGGCEDCAARLLRITAAIDALAPGWAQASDVRPARGHC